MNDDYTSPIEAMIVGQEDPTYYCPRCGSVVKLRADLKFRCYDCMWESE